MNKKILIGLIILLGIVFALLKFKDSSDKSAQKTTIEKSILQPDKAQKIKKLTIENKDSKITLGQNSEKEWGIIEQDNFPAKDDKLVKLFNALQDKQHFVVATSNSSRFIKLGTDYKENDKPIGDTTIINLYNGEGDKPFKTLVYGKVREGNSAPNPAQRYQPPSPMRYFRELSEKKSWIINKVPPLEADAESWMTKDVLKLDSKEIVEVNLARADGSSFMFKREGDKFKMDGLADNEQLKAKTLDDIVKFVSELKYDDIKPGGNTSFSRSEKQAVLKVFISGGDKFTLTFDEEKLKDASKYIMTIQSEGQSKHATKINSHYVSRIIELNEYRINKIKKERKDFVEPKQEPKAPQPQGIAPSLPVPVLNK